MPVLSWVTWIAFRRGVRPSDRRGTCGHRQATDAHRARRRSDGSVILSRYETCQNDAIRLKREAIWLPGLHRAIDRRETPDRFSES